MMAGRHVSAVRRSCFNGRDAAVLKGALAGRGAVKVRVVEAMDRRHVARGHMKVAIIWDSRDYVRAALVAREAARIATSKKRQDKHRQRR